MLYKTRQHRLAAVFPALTRDHDQLESGFSNGHGRFFSRRDGGDIRPRQGAAPSLSTFDLNVSFDQSILSFRTVAFGPFLGDHSLGESITSFIISTPGIVNLFELSYLEGDFFKKFSGRIKTPLFSELPPFNKKNSQ